MRNMKITAKSQSRKSVRDLIAISKKVAAEEMEFDKDPESEPQGNRKTNRVICKKKMKKSCRRTQF